MLQRFEDRDGFVGYRSPLLAERGIPHLFTTRRAGAGLGELDLGRLDAARRERVAHAAGLERAPLVAVKQVHGASVCSVGRDALPGSAVEADALLSERDDVLLAVHVADCVPVLLSLEDGRRVAAVHAGWRGIVAGVLPRTVELLGSGRALAAIGPCLSLERFEVGPEVVAAFAKIGLDSCVHGSPGERAHIDLRKAVAEQLRQAGVDTLESSDRCTWTHADEFFSYRRDVTHGGRPRTGRLGALIAAAPRGRAPGRS